MKFTQKYLFYDKVANIVGATELRTVTVTVPLGCILGMTE